MSLRKQFYLLVFVAVISNGCSVKTPSVSHTHIGHTITGWVDTPDKQGLFTVAENKAHESLRFAEDATNKGNALSRIKADMEKVIQATKSPENTEGLMTKYDVNTALTGVIHHIIFASTSDDASSNVKNFAAGFKNNAMTILDRCDLIGTYGKEIKNSMSQTDVAVLASEVLLLTRTNIFGNDSDGDSIVGSNPGEYGLVQLRRDLEAMIKREDPPYQTVDTWYLFNLIRLPDGKWKFRSRGSGYSGSGY
jgi:hypothetical protein